MYYNNDLYEVKVLSKYTHITNLLQMELLGLVIFLNFYNHYIIFYIGTYLIASIFNYLLKKEQWHKILIIK